MNIAEAIQLIIDSDEFKEAAKNVVTQGGLCFPLENTGLQFRPDIQSTDSGNAIEFYGDTGSSNQQMPYLLSAYFAPNGTFCSGVWMVISNKRKSIEGEIQGVSALVDGSEPSMVCISPDVNGPALAIEGGTEKVAGNENNCAIAFYNMDERIGGLTAYSQGYCRKRAVILGNGTMMWGTDLGVDPHENADIAVLKPVEGGLELKGGFTASKFMFPRVTAEEMIAIQNPEEGQAVYNTTSHSVCYWQGSYWSDVNW